MFQKSPLGPPLGAFGAPPGGILAPTWPQFGPIGPQLGPNLTSSRPILAPTGPILASTCLSQSRFGTQVGQRCPQDPPKDPILEDFGSFWEPFWSPLGGSGGGLGTQSGANLLHETLQPSCTRIARTALSSCTSWLGDLVRGQNRRRYLCRLTCKQPLQHCPPSCTHLSSISPPKGTARWWLCHLDPRGALWAHRACEITYRMPSFCTSLLAFTFLHFSSCTHCCTSLLAFTLLHIT